MNSNLGSKDIYSINIVFTSNTCFRIHFWGVERFLKLNKHTVELQQFFLFSCLLNCLLCVVYLIVVSLVFVHRHFLLSWNKEKKFIFIVGNLCLYGKFEDRENSCKAANTKHKVWYIRQIILCKCSTNVLMPFGHLFKNSSQPSDYRFLWFSYIRHCNMGKK